MLALLLAIWNFVWPWLVVIGIVAFCCCCWFDNETSWGGYRKP